MEYSPLLVPVVALVGWTLIVMIWMMAARMREFRRLGVTFRNIPDGSRGVDMDGKADPRAQWKSHNYNHLMEQPTIFYAIALALAMMGMDQPINVWLAWGYVGFRIIHSLVQGTVNIVRFRLPIFLLATFCLLGLTVHAGARILHDCGII